MIFWPNPPPTLGAMTRILSSSMSNSEASPPRTEIVAWVESQTVSSPDTPSQRAAMARHSIGAAVERSSRTRTVVVCSAAAKAASASPLSWTKCAATLFGMSSWTGGAPSAIAFSRSSSTGSGSYSTSTTEHASSAVYLSTATTIAMHWPA